MSIEEKTLAIAFDGWVDLRLDILRDALYPFYFHAYNKHGKGMVIFEFKSVEEIKEGEPDPNIFFGSFPKETLPVHENLKKHQGKGWLPMLAVVPFEGQTKVFAGILLGWGTPKKISRMALQTLRDKEGPVYVKGTQGGPRFCVM